MFQIRTRSALLQRKAPQSLNQWNHNTERNQKFNQRTQIPHCFLGPLSITAQFNQQRTWKKSVQCYIFRLQQQSWRSISGRDRVHQERSIYFRVGEETDIDSKGEWPAASDKENKKRWALIYFFLLLSKGGYLLWIYNKWAKKAKIERHLVYKLRKTAKTLINSLSNGQRKKRRRFEPPQKRKFKTYRKCYLVYQQKIMWSLPPRRKRGRTPTLRQMWWLLPSTVSQPTHGNPPRRRMDLPNLPKTTTNGRRTHQYSFLSYRVENHRRTIDNLLQVQIAPQPNDLPQWQRLTRQSH